MGIARLCGREGKFVDVTDNHHHIVNFKMLCDGILDELNHVVFVSATKKWALTLGVLSDREIEDNGHAEIIIVFTGLCRCFMILIGFLGIVEDASTLPFKRRCFRRIMPTMFGDTYAMICAWRNWEVGSQ